MSGFGECVLVIGALAATCSLPAWRLSARISGAFGWPAVLLGSIVLGTGSQAIFGLFWGRFVRADAKFEFLFYLTFWLAVNLLLLAVRKIPGRHGAGIPFRESLALAAVSGAALAVRIIHPLQHYALGQSDAYSHLDFLRDILQYGYLRNHVYPPGFSWILALPTWLFRLDPYNTCRFGGAFFGAALVLAIYVLLRERKGAGAALGGAFLAACFPGLNLLLKTGVGVFPNQYGLFLLPAIMYFALESGRVKFSLSSGNVWLLMFSLASMAVTVPMMLFHVTWVLLLAAVLSRLTPGPSHPFPWAPLILLLAPALILVAVHFSQVSSRDVTATLNAISEGAVVSAVEAVDETASPVLERAATLWPYIKDYFSIKRIGLDSLLLNLAGAGLGLAFLLVALGGIVFRDALLGLMGSWGILGVLHVCFGFLQFSSYQREGWSLLVAAACLGGIVAGVVSERLMIRPGGALCVYGAAAAVLAVSLLRPPGHVFMFSGAEEEIVKLVRMVQKEGVASALNLSGKDHESGSALISGCSPPEKEWVVVTRRFIQRDLVDILLDRDGPYTAEEVNIDTDLKELIKREKCYMILVERAELPDPFQLSVLGSINQPLLQRLASYSAGTFESHQRLMGLIEVFENEGWETVRIADDEKLEVVLSRKR